MCPFECYIFEEAMDHETDFAGIHTQGYYKLTDNIWRVGNMISKSKQESKQDPRQTAQISNPSKGEESSLQFVILRGAEEAKFGDKKESSFL